MSAERLRASLRSVGVTPVTPFTSDAEHINADGLRDNTAFLADRGIRLLYPCGNTGEFSSLSSQEWTTIVETVVDTAGEQCSVVPGVGGPLPVAKELLHRGARIGVNAFLLMPPHQPHVADLGVERYWRALMDASGLPVVLYKRSWPTDHTLESLAREEQVVAVKYGVRDPEAFAALASSSEGTLWTCGVAERWAPAFALSGHTGFTSGLANFAPGFSLSLSDALRAGDYARAMDIRSQAVHFEDIRARDNDANNVGAVKHALDLHDLAGGPVRPPLRNLDEATRGEVDVAIKGLDV